MTGYIMWNPDPVLFTAGGMTVRWYGVMFATGLVLAAWYVWRRFRRKGYPQGYFDALMVLSFVLMFLGARLCHCLFYEPGYYLSHPVEMVFPVKRVAGEWTFTGFYGLASHGGAAGLVCAVLLLKWWKGAPALEVMDDMAIATPLAGGFIRTGNLINSEIVGGVTDVPWAFVFEAYDPLPRHPAQIYEGAFYLLLFAVMATVCRRRGYGKVKPGHCVHRHRRVPLRDRVFQGGAGGFRERAGTQHGSVAQRAVHRGGGAAACVHPEARG